MPAFFDLRESFSSRIQNVRPIVLKSDFEPVWLTVQQALNLHDEGVLNSVQVVVLFFIHKSTVGRFPNSKD